MKNFIEKALLVAVGVFIGVGLNFAFAQWQGPSASPPQGNIDPPLTQGSQGQVKKGNLTVNLDDVYEIGLTVVGNAMWLPTQSDCSSYAPPDAGMVCFDLSSNKLEVSISDGVGGYLWTPVH